MEGRHDLGAPGAAPLQGHRAEGHQEADAEGVQGEREAHGAAAGQAEPQFPGPHLHLHLVTNPGL